MAKAKLFFQGKRDFKVGKITFDLLLSENHEFSNDISEHPVEDGTVISDHIQNAPQQGGLVGIISNYSLRTFGNLTNRAQDAFEEMIKLWKSKQLVTVVTVMRVYPEMAITNISVARSSDTGEAIPLSISFRELKKVRLKAIQISTTVNIKDPSSPIKRQAISPQDAGQQTGTVKPPPPRPSGTMRGIYG